ncbi:branched-chain amino acid ABC transporter permease [Pseudogracilibacillus auburnensis]|uniref:Amino acid/amide ABC transporter membrane protein 2 (HAAT family) n=1 Tax=Pseudogracilibacillus auburnensis TaxID=1494959 RepID=A0A2V3W9T9_9BACI|nr:branched-chain amino acid ABC transporter permease [Pseudogracilibacillus auburnensis]MBO1003683.1 branched-chain amino acid ABC transporter permease [Pseudogracilibacillus auburnensis]PXW90306.1 amino acid/amide ABC transporter membrane protein 2 (HAAT family) [Pseudogracilibacillus auburnensis]
MIAKMRGNYLLLTIIIIALALFPFVSDSRTLTILLTQIFIFAILAMSYDVLLGYTGIVSFGHAMFFGIGAYATAIILKKTEPTMLSFFLSIIVGMLLAGIVSFIIGLLTLRLQSHFFAMFTLAVSGLFLVAAEKSRTLTQGNDGFTFRAPEFFADRTTFYLFVLACLLIIFLLLRLFVHSPFGSVLIAVKENETRSAALGYKAIYYKVMSSVVAGVVASLAGSLYVVSLRFVNTSVMGIDITLNALLMTIIGGVGTLVGPILGAAIIQLAQHNLSNLAKTYPIFERWIIFFGIIYILAVIFFPKGVVGTIREKLGRKS